VNFDPLPSPKSTAGAHPRNIVPLDQPPERVRNRPMILAVTLALPPVIFVLVMTVRELRPWWEQFKEIRSLPECPPRPTRPRLPLRACVVQLMEMGTAVTRSVTVRRRPCRDDPLRSVILSTYLPGLIGFRSVSRMRPPVSVPVAYVRPHWVSVTVPCVPAGGGSPLTVRGAHRMAPGDEVFEVDPGPATGIARHSVRWKSRGGTPLTAPRPVMAPQRDAKSSALIGLQ
jgi:hypothetical protein